MAVTPTPVFVQVPFARVARISAANTARDGTGTVVTIATAGSNGSRVDRIVIQADGTTTAGVVRLFVYDGSAYHLWKEVLVTAITPSATIEAFRAELARGDGQPVLDLESGFSLRAATHNAEGFQVFAHGGDR